MFRDEKDFEPSACVQSEIFKNIRKSDVFVAVWCKEYACSPWCFDELDYALACKENSDLEIWLLVIRVLSRQKLGIWFIIKSQLAKILKVLH